MPEYQFHLRSLDFSDPMSEPVSALDDDEARGLAEIRLLLTRGVAAVTVSRSGVQILHVERDGRREPAGLPGASSAHLVSSPATEIVIDV